MRMIIMKNIFATLLILTRIQLVMSIQNEVETPKKTKTKSKGKPKTCTKFICLTKLHKDIQMGRFSGFVIEGQFLIDLKQDIYNGQNETQCVKLCVKWRSKCKTISIVQNGVNNVTCFISSSNVFNLKTRAVKKSKIISLGSAECMKSPCKNGGTCNPNYQNGGYSCACPNKWTGKNCQIINPESLPNVTFPLDHDVNPVFNNKTRGESYRITAPKGFRLASVPDSKTPVLMSTPTSTKVVTYNIENLGFFTNPVVSPRNLTFSFWFKADFSKEKEKPCRLFNLEKYLSINVMQNTLNLFFATSRGILSLKCKNGNFHKAWNHFAAGFNKEKVWLSLNGKQCDSMMVSGFGSKGGHGEILELLPPATDEIYTKFIDLIKIYNKALTSKEVKKLYDMEKKNYLIP